MKTLHNKKFNACYISNFIEKERDLFYSDHGDNYKLMKSMGEAIGYAKVSWATNNITEDEANALIEQAETVMKEITG